MNEFDINKFAAETTEKIAKEGATAAWRLFRKNRLANALKKDFEKMTLPEEVELGLLEKNIKYPLLIYSSSYIPTKIQRTIPILNFSSPLAVDAQRAIYQVGLLLDNFLPEQKAMLPLEASLGIIFAHAEIRASRNFQDSLFQLLRSLTPIADYYREIANWSEVKRWEEIFYTLFEAGLYFSVVLPKIVEIYNRCSKRPTKDGIDECMSFIEAVYKIDSYVRKGKIPERKLLIFDGKILGKIGFVLVNPSIEETILKLYGGTGGEVPAIIEEKIDQGCKEIIILSRGIYNIWHSLKGVMETLANTKIKGKNYGVSKTKIEESFLIQDGVWATALRITLNEQYYESYKEEVQKMKEQSKILFYIIKEPSARLGASVNEIETIRRKLKRKKKILITNEKEGIAPACVIETIRTLRTLHFTEKITFSTEEDKYPQLKVFAFLELLE